MSETDRVAREATSEEAEGVATLVAAFLAVLVAFLATGIGALSVSFAADSVVFFAVFLAAIIDGEVEMNF